MSHFISDCKINFSKAADQSPSLRKKTFYPKKLLPADFFKFVSVFAWSPALFKNNARNQENFLEARVIGLDFDSGEPTIPQMIDWIEEHKLFAAIGKSKSCGQWKDNKKPCDRFRLIILAKEPIYDGRQYRENIRYFWNLLPTADTSCIDESRFYSPSQIVYVNDEGALYAWQDFPIKQITYAPVTKGAFTPWIMSQISQPIQVGGRNSMAHKVAKALFRRHFGKDEVYGIIRGSETFRVLGDEDPEIRKLKGTVESAFNRVHRESV